MTDYQALLNQLFQQWKDADEGMDAIIKVAKLLDGPELEDPRGLVKVPIVKTLAKSANGAGRPAQGTVNGVKRCTKCRKTTKEGAEFGAREASPDGLNTQCKQCLRDYQNDRHRKQQAERMQKLHKADDTVITVPCDVCGSAFPNAKAMGIHKTRIHFNERSSAQGSSLGHLNA